MIFVHSFIVALLITSTAAFYVPPSDSDTATVTATNVHLVCSGPTEAPVVAVVTTPKPDWNDDASDTWTYKADRPGRPGRPMNPHHKWNAVQADVAASDTVASSAVWSAWSTATSSTPKSTTSSSAWTTTYTIPTWANTSVTSTWSTATRSATTTVKAVSFVTTTTTTQSSSVPTGCRKYHFRGLVSMVCQATSCFD
jgi:hypothetical protein